MPKTIRGPSGDNLKSLGQRAFTELSVNSFEPVSLAIDRLQMVKTVRTNGSECNIAVDGEGMIPSEHEITELLVAWRNGDKAALDKLMPLVYQELRVLARRYAKREGLGDALQATSLVHEAYVRLAGRREVHWQNRAHFFAVCAKVMRGLLVDRARGRQATKRGGGLQQIELQDIADISPARDAELLALDEALDKLAEIDPRKADIVQMRYFGGMTVDETAEVLDLAPITIKREWLKARAWLYREMKRHEDGSAHSQLES